MRRGVTLGLCATLAWTLVTALLLMGPGPLVRSAELALYDTHLRAVPVKPDPRCVIVALDEETLTRLPDLENPFYPLPRRYHARVVENLRRAGARVVAFDLFFTKATHDDATFAAALARHGNAVGVAIPQVSLVDGAEQVLFSPPAPSLAPQLTLGSVLLPRDGPVRRFVALRSDDATLSVRMPHFSLAVAAAFFDESDRQPLLRDTFTWGTRIAAPTEDGDILIRFPAKPGAFPTLRYADIYNGRFDPAVVRDRIALIGPMLPLEDRHPTPVGLMAGTEVLATIVDMALSGDWLRSGSVWISLAVAALGLTVQAALQTRRGPGVALLSAVLAAPLWLGATRFVFVRYGVWLWATPPLLAAPLSLLISLPIELLRARRALERFLPSWAVRRAFSPAPLGRATADRPVAVVFCDIRGFTAYCETHSADEAEALLQAYFDAGDAAARRFGTELDKFVGDQIMLSFFARPHGEHHALRAVRWALAMVDAMREREIEIGIGIATGVAREGFIGAKGRLQSTVIGDVVNTAARLEEATRAQERTILIDDGTFSPLGGAIACEPLGTITVRGRQTGTVIYAPVVERA